MISSHYSTIFKLVDDDVLYSCKSILVVSETDMATVQYLMNNPAYASVSESQNINLFDQRIGFIMSLVDIPLIQEIDTETETVTTIDKKYAHQAVLYIGVFINYVDTGVYYAYPVTSNRAGLDTPVKLTIDSVTFDSVNSSFAIQVVIFSKQPFNNYEITIVDNGSVPVLGSYQTQTLSINANQITLDTFTYPQPATDINPYEHTVFIRVTIAGNVYAESRTFSTSPRLEPNTKSFDTFNHSSSILSNTILNHAKIREENSYKPLNNLMLTDSYLIHQTHPSIFTIDRVHVSNDLIDYNINVTNVHSISAERVVSGDTTNPYNYVSDGFVNTHQYVSYPLETLLFNAKNFQRSDTGNGIRYFENGKKVRTTSNRKLLSLKRFKIPLYVECHLKMINNQTSILVGNGYEYGDVVH